MLKAMIAVVLFSVSALAAPKPEAPATRAAKATGHAALWTLKLPYRAVTWPFRAPKPAKKADGTGPIQTCRPGTNCDPIV